MVKKRGQNAVELTILLGLVLTVSLVLSYLLIQQISESQKIAKVEDAVLSLVDKANKVSVLGSGTKNMSLSVGSTMSS